MTRAALVLFVLAAGCGYSVGLENFGAGVRRVAVEVADNHTFRQDFERGLTRRIHEQLAVHTDLRPGPRESADAILRVSIDDLRNDALVRDASPVREGSLDFVATVELVERASGAVLRSRQVLDRGEFRIPVGESSSSATEEALSDLARKIVLALEGGF